jgi:hypothetical protein
MKIFSYKTGLITGTAITLAVSGLIHAQQPANLEPVLRELGIMRNIFAAAMEQNQDNKFFGNGPAPDALYLARQGMIFTFNLPQGNGFNSFMYCDKDCADFSFDFDADIDIDVPDADIDVPGGLPSFPAMAGILLAQEQLRETNEALRERNDELRELNEALRDKNDELRQLQRDMRELAREQRNNPDDESLETQMETLREQNEELQNELEQQSDAYRQMNEDIQNERIAAANTLREAHIDQVLGVLCDYGSTLKALPADENVSLVFRNFAGNADQVYVFSRAAVADCTSADSLQQSAISYQASADGIAVF